MAALGGVLVMARATQGTIAGIGLQEVAGKKEPRIWTALLDQFAVTFQNEEATVDTTDTSGAHVDTVWEIMVTPHTGPNTLLTAMSCSGPSLAWVPLTDPTC